MRRKSSGKGSVPCLRLLLFILVRVEAEVRAAEDDDDDDDVTGVLAPGVSATVGRVVEYFQRRSNV
jgi:hypothetical protein